MADYPYWTDNGFATRQITDRFEHLTEQVHAARLEGAADLRGLLSAIHQLETDIGRTLLKVHTLVHVLEEKGVISTQELAARASELDAMDGVTDGVLDPKLFRTEEERTTPSPRMFLIALEDKTISPREFLAELERQDDVEKAEGK